LGDGLAVSGRKLRLWSASLAYVLIEAVRRLGLEGTRFAAG
jgi:hypothetical protein